MVALVTGASLVIQLIPVAPPRLLPHLGIVDTAAVVGSDGRVAWIRRTDMGPSPPSCGADRDA